MACISSSFIDDEVGYFAIKRIADQKQILQFLQGILDLQ